MESLLGQIVVLAEQSGKNPLGEYKPFLWAAAIALLAFFLLRKTQSRVARSQTDRQLSVQERVAKKINGGDIYSQISAQMAQLAELSRQINGQIDTRVAKLEILIAEAERTILKLEKLTGKSPQELAQALSQSHADRDAASTIKAISEKFKDTSDPKEEIESGVSSFESMSNNQEILDLSDSGLSAVEIAKKLHRPVGEIELVLSLSGKKTRP